MTDTVITPQHLGDDQLDPITLKAQFQQLLEQQKQDFLANVPVAELVYQRTDYMDALLVRLWHHFGFDQSLLHWSRWAAMAGVNYTLCLILIYSYFAKHR